ncbi:MAG: hypothetical protein H6710_19825 [Myxococcales bacterium]|nr:hypothetical protein [Myxococcales bacterium]MCB9706236.1 hypothetical protein [Myxococcales bacterium]
MSDEPRPDEPQDDQPSPGGPASPWGAGPTSFDYMVDDAPAPTISAGDVIRRSLTVLGDNFVAFFAIAVICYVPDVIWSVFLGGLTIGMLKGHVPQVLAPAVPVIGAAMFWLLSGFIAQAVMIGRTVESMAQRSDALGAVFMLGLRRLPQVLAVSLLATLAPLVFCGLGIYALFLLQPPSNLFLLLSVAAIFMGTGAVACALYVAVPAVVVEEVSIFGALRRSWRLTHGSRLIIFAALFITGIAQGIIEYLVGKAVPFAVAGAVADVALSLITGAFGATLGAVTYVRLRETSEGVHASALFDGLSQRLKR